MRQLSSYPIRIMLARSRSAWSGTSGMALAVDEQRRRRRGAGAQRVADVAPDAVGRRVGRGGRPRSGRGRARARGTRSHRCGSSRRPWSAYSASCNGQNAPCSAAASAACASAHRARVLGLQREVAEDDARDRRRARGARARRRSAGRRSRRRGRRAARRPAPRTWSSARSGGTGALPRSVHRAAAYAPYRACTSTSCSASSVLPGSPEEVFAFFADARNLEAITPPLLRFEVVTPDPIADAASGRSSSTACALHGVRVGWLTSIQEWDPPHRFVDVQVRGPYALWHHTHEFEPRSASARRSCATWCATRSASARSASWRARLVVERDVRARSSTSGARRGRRGRR